MSVSATTAPQLAQAEQRIGKIAGEIDGLDTRIHETGARLEELEKRREALADEMAAHQRTLAAQLRAAYRMGRRPGLRLLLGQDDPAAAARALGYYAYLNEARIGAMERAQRLADELDTVARETRAAENSLREDRAALATKRDELEGMRSERAELVARLERSIASDDERLSELRRRRQRLDGILEELGRVLGDTDAATEAERPFASRSGELPWPAEGALRTRFGADRAGGRMQWRGLIIGADAGEKVRAVHHGRVVFADWLSGFGQLIILDHQDGHLTLYGFNERLLREHGEFGQGADRDRSRVGATGRGCTSRSAAVASRSTLCPGWPRVSPAGRTGVRRLHAGCSEQC